MLSSPDLKLNRGSSKDRSDRSRDDRRPASSSAGLVRKNEEEASGSGHRPPSRRNSQVSANDSINETQSRGGAAASSTANDSLFSRMAGGLAGGFARISPRLGEFIGSGGDSPDIDPDIDDKDVDMKAESVRSASNLSDIKIERSPSPTPPVGGHWADQSTNSEKEPFHTGWETGDGSKKRDAQQQREGSGYIPSPASKKQRADSAPTKNSREESDGDNLSQDGDLPKKRHTTNCRKRKFSINFFHLTSKCSKREEIRA